MKRTAHLMKHDFINEALSMYFQVTNPVKQKVVQNKFKVL